LGRLTPVFLSSLSLNQSAAWISHLSFVILTSVKTPLHLLPLTLNSLGRKKSMSSSVLSVGKALFLETLLNRGLCFAA